MKRKLLCKCIILLALVSGSLQACHLANNIHVPCNVTSLVAAINSANTSDNPTNIFLEGDCEYILTLVDNQAGFDFLPPGNGANGLPVIRTPIYIIGDPDFYSGIRRSPLPGTPEFRIFFVSGNGSLSLRDVYLEGGINHYAGGGIAVDQGSLVLVDSSLDWNSSPDGGGGAIFNNGGRVVLHGSSLNNNTALRGGVISNVAGGTVLIDQNSILLGNIADIAAAIDNVGGALTIRNSTIENNHAHQQAGGILNQGTAVLDTVRFVQNGVAEGPVSTGSGGAVANLGQNTPADLTVTNCFFRYNNARRGGAIDNLAGTATITSSEFQDNRAQTWGGGITNQGTASRAGSLTVSGSLFVENTARYGGGLFNDGLATIIDTTFEGNENFGQIGDMSQGGGLVNGVSEGSGARLTIVGSTFKDNISREGGGIVNLGSLALMNSTLSGNQGLYGSGLQNEAGNTLIYFSTIVNNLGGPGGGIDSLNGTITVRNSILADNTNNCAWDQGAVVAQGENISNDDTCPGFSLLADPVLTGLGDYGGATFTHGLLPGSPAIDAASDCTDYLGNPLATDQRGITRPSPPGGQCDIGAYETLQTISSVPTRTLTPTTSEPFVRALQDLNCRAGSSTAFASLAVLTAGQAAPVLAVNPSQTWLVIRNPQTTGECWVWAGGVELTGSLEKVRVVPDPLAPASTLTSAPDTLPSGPETGCLVGNLTAAPVCVVPCPPNASPGIACTP